MVNLLSPWPAAEAIFSSSVLGNSGTKSLSPQCFSPSLTPPAVGIASLFSSLPLRSAVTGGLWELSPEVEPWWARSPLPCVVLSVESRPTPEPTPEPWWAESWPRPTPERGGQSQDRSRDGQS
jgi:hypothetical protein